MYSLLFLAVSCHGAPQTRNSDVKTTETRNCYRNTWFSQSGCELSPSLRNGSCSDLPKYDCDSFYLGMQGRHPDADQHLTKICQPGEESNLSLLRAQPLLQPTTPCEFNFVCVHDPNRIPSTYWKANLINGERCRNLPGTCLPVYRSTSVLKNVGCDRQVGQFRYVNAVVKEKVAWICIQPIDPLKFPRQG